MKHPRVNMIQRLLASSLAIGAVTLAQASDNSKTNQRDRDSATQQTTPQNATETKQDLETLQSIRKAIIDDKNLSTYAHNVKITVKNGATTLRGPVRSESEKMRIEQLAKANGATSVGNELEIVVQSAK